MGQTTARRVPMGGTVPDPEELERSSSDVGQGDVDAADPARSRGMDA